MGQPHDAPSAADPCTRLSGIGPTLAAKLASLGIDCIGDLLLHRPLRYEDRTRLTPIAAMVPRTQVLALVRVEAAEVRYTRRRSLLITATDGQQRLWLRLFHFSVAQQQRLVPGVWLRLFGEVRTGLYGLEMVHPEYRVVADAAAGEAFTPQLLPVYPTTAGLSQKRLRSATDQALELLAMPGFWPEYLPRELAAEWDGYSSAQALQCLHRPAPDVDLMALTAGQHPACARLAFEELLGHQLALRRRRRHIRQAQAPPMAARTNLAALIDAFGFQPTAAQSRVIAEVQADLQQATPMLRLIQGDVGSGKTVVAAAAAFTTAMAGWQTAFMAPTELLAEQHFSSLSRWLEPLGVAVWLLTGKSAADEAVAAAIAAGQAGVIVGTHALFQEATALGRLGLCVVDEQHRFGVDQRLALREKASAAGVVAHQLIMTATPIPRTLAMSAYADLDTSVIDELPPGRTPVVTVAVPNTRREEVIERIAEAVRAGRQVYWVCTLIEESDKLEAQAAEATAEVLADALPKAHVGLTHGRMRSADKQRAMAAFKARRMDVLVATTVIEVGVDVPNASLMIIENAERLGLAQLHQLRGRVGRGAVESHCVLLYQAPLSETARKRLTALRKTNDGFAIARADLELRGPGEVLGTRQTGLASFRVADLQRDASLAEKALACADRVLNRHPRAAERLIERWVGTTGGYASV